MAVALALCLLSSSGCSRARAQRRAALADRTRAAAALGSYLAAHFQGSSAVVLSNPFAAEKNTPRNIRDFEQAALAGLRKGLGTKVTIAEIVHPRLKTFSGSPYKLIRSPTTTPLSYLMDDAALDDVIRTHPDCRLVISLIGIPAGIRTSSFWKHPGTTSLALLLPDLSFLGDESSIRYAFKSGRVTAAVLPDKHRDKLREGPRDFLVVDQSNIADFLHDNAPHGNRSP